MLCASCAKTIPVDRRDPQAVLQAYFAAWARSDWSGEASFMDAKYAGMTPEPLDSLRILQVRPGPVESPTGRTYQVIFEIKVKGQGISMQSGQYNWSYTLTWEAQRGSWLISNYGAG